MHKPIVMARIRWLHCSAEMAKYGTPESYLTSGKSDSATVKFPVLLRTAVPPGTEYINNKQFVLFWFNFINTLYVFFIFLQIY